MKNVSTGVLKKYEQYLRSKDKAEKWYDLSRHMIAYVKMHVMHNNVQCGEYT